MALPAHLTQGSMINFRKRKRKNVVPSCCNLNLDPPKLYVFPTYERLIEMVKNSLDDDFIKKKRKEKEMRFKSTVNLLMLTRKKFI